MLRNIQSESPRSLYRFLSSLLIALMIMGVGPQAVWAAPQGAQVVTGNVQFSHQGSVTTIRASNNSIINYQSFDIAKPETVQFLQPSTAARVLNRIQGLDPTHIDGALLANGHVYIVNPAGIYFGQDAVVNVGALVAAAGAISNQDFENGVDHFTGVKGQVINLGAIKGDIVALLGKEVANRGTITSHDGLIALVAGNDVVLVPSDGHLRVRIASDSADAAPTDAFGVENSGKLDAGKGEVNLAAGDVYSLAIRQTPDGSITAHDIALDGGKQGAVQVSGTLDASDASPGAKGGNISVLGDKVALEGAHLDASGDAGGGSVLVGGDLHGGGGVQTASTTSVSSDSSIDANAVTQGDGGKVVVWSDKATQFAGRINARGGAQGGNGGFAEVSGKAWLAYQGLTDLTAPQGLMGTLLLDPTNITIQSGGTDTIPGSPPQLLFGDPPTDASIDASTVVSALDGANVLLQATNNISVEQAIDSSGNAGSGDLTLEAGNGIFLNASITLNGSFTASAGSATSIGNFNDGPPVAITTTGSQTYTGNVQVTDSAPDDTITSSGGGSIDFQGAVDGPGGLTENTAGTTTFAGDVGATQALAELVMAGTGETIFGTGGTSPFSVQTIGAQSYGGNVVINLVGADATLETVNPTTGTAPGTGDVTFQGPVDGPGGLTVNTAGTTTFAGDVGASQALAELVMAGTGQTFFGTDGAGPLSVRTAGLQRYGGNVVIELSGANPDAILSSTGGGAIDFLGGVDGPGGLTVNTGGTTTFTGNVGASQALASLQTNGGGITGLDGGSVTTLGGQTYDEALSLGSNTTLASTGGGAISFRGPIDGPWGLTVATAGTTTFGGNVGAAHALVELMITGTGQTIFGTGGAGPLSVTTIGAQTYGGNVAIDLSGPNPDAVLVSGKQIDFQGGVDGPGGLVVNTTGTTTFAGDVGATQALAELVMAGTGQTSIGHFNDGPPVSITTTGSQTYMGNVQVTDSAPDDTMTSTGGGTIDFQGAVDGPGGLNVNAPGGSVFFGGDIGLEVPLASLTVNVGTGPDGRIGFVSPNTTQMVNVLGDVALNPGGRASAPSLVATIFRQAADPYANPIVPGNLVIDSQKGNIIVGRNELFTAVGDLTLTAANDVTTGALTALDLTINADPFFIEPQTSGLTNIIANVIQVNAALATTPPGQNGVVQFATPTGGASNELSANVLNANPSFLISSIYPNAKSVLQPSALLEGNTVVTVSLGPAIGNQNSGSPLPSGPAVPTAPGWSGPLTIPPFTPFPGPNQVAVSDRPLRPSEVSAFLDCNPHDKFCQDQAVGAIRANSAAAKNLRKSFDAVFGKVTPKENPHRKELQDAVDAYHKAFGNGPIGGVEFRQFVESRNEYRPALKVLDDLGTLFVNANAFGMTVQGLQQFEMQRLEEIAPTGIDVAQLQKAVEAGNQQKRKATAWRQPLVQEDAATG